MGGGFVLLGLLAVALLWLDLSQPLVQAVMILVYSFALIGFWDDFLKLKKASAKGLRPRFRLGLEFCLSLLVLAWLAHKGHISTHLYLPFFKDLSWDLGWAYLLFSAFVITGTANAVNLTDGLDGLAVFPVMICSAAFFFFAYLAGHSEMADYLNIPFVMGASELSPLSAAIVAACLGFFVVQCLPGTSLFRRCWIPCLRKLSWFTCCSHKK